MKQETYDIWYPSFRRPGSKSGPTCYPKAYQMEKVEDLPKYKQDPLHFFQQQRKKFILCKENPNKLKIIHWKDTDSYEATFPSNLVSK